MAKPFVKPPEMIDANVLIFAARSHHSDDTSDIRELIQDSKQVVMRLPVIRMSAVSMAEVARRMTTAEYRSLAEMGKPFDDVFAEPLTGDIGRLAAGLVNRRSHSDKLCRRCQNVLPKTDQKPCSGCGGTPSPHRRLDDAFIVATAAMTKGVQTLITADNGLIELGKLLTDPDIRVEFPAVHSLSVEFVRVKHGPLFDRSAEAPLELVTKLTPPIR